MRLRLSQAALRRGLLDLLRDQPLIDRGRRKWDERTLITRTCRSHEIRVVGTLAEAYRRRGLAGALPRNLRVWIVALREVDQFREIVDLLGIDRDLGSIPVSLAHLLAPVPAHLIQPWRRPRPLWKWRRSVFSKGAETEKKREQYRQPTPRLDWIEKRRMTVWGK